MLGSYELSDLLCLLGDDWNELSSTAPITDLRRSRAIDIVKRRKSASVRARGFESFSRQITRDSHK